MRFLTFAFSPQGHPSDAPPLVVGLPILGSVVSYALNPIRFLTKQAKKNHGLFTMRLGDKNFVVIASREGLSQYYKAPEETLSEYSALETLGYVNLLGPTAVFKVR